jgi:hypothetical protein
LSDDKKLKQGIHDADQQINDKEELINEITDDIFKILIAELKVELDLLLLKDPRRFINEEEGKIILNLNSLYSTTELFFE